MLISMICDSAIIIFSGEDFKSFNGISSKPALSFGLVFLSIFFTSIGHVGQMYMDSGNLGPRYSEKSL